MEGTREGRPPRIASRRRDDDRVGVSPGRGRKNFFFLRGCPCFARGPHFLTHCLSQSSLARPSTFGTWFTRAATLRNPWCLLLPSTLSTSFPFLLLIRTPSSSSSGRNFSNCIIGRLEAHDRKWRVFGIFFFYRCARFFFFFLNMEVTSSSFPCWKRKKGSFGIFSKFHYIKTDYMKRSFEILINVSVSFFFFNKEATSSSFFGIFRKLYYWKIGGTMEDYMKSFWNFLLMC